VSGARTVAGEIEHGTYGGYQAHKRIGEGPCTDCRRANSSYQAAWRRRNPASQSLNAERQAARDRALRKLAERFPAELESLYAAELAALHLGGAGAA
jgi:hypothetical protein